jgi:membrane protease YdiL (CAAX protease family)
LAVSVVPIYLLTIISHIFRDTPITLEGIILYSGGVGGVATIIILLLLRYLCGERPADLNLKPGKWWLDIVSSILLAIITLVLLTLTNNTIGQLIPSQSFEALEGVFGRLAESPGLLALFLGVVLWIGVAFEEITRVFMLSRLWKLWPAPVGQWVAVVISAILFGLGHLYQGWGGVITTAIYGLVMAIYYRLFGRVVPMIVSHYIHDALQFILLVSLIRQGVITF